MNRLNFEPVPMARSDLERLIEPLVSYICAAGRPKADLILALRLLVSEVEKTNRAASARFGIFIEN